MSLTLIKTMMEQEFIISFKKSLITQNLQQYDVVQDKVTLDEVYRAVSDHCEMNKLNSEYNRNNLLFIMNLHTTMSLHLGELEFCNDILETINNLMVKHNNLHKKNDYQAFIGEAMLATLQRIKDSAEFTEKQKMMVEEYLASLKVSDSKASMDNIYTLFGKYKKWEVAAGENKSPKWGNFPFK